MSGCIWFLHPLPPPRNEIFQLVRKFHFLNPLLNNLSKGGQWAILIQKNSEGGGYKIKRISNQFISWFELTPPSSKVADVINEWPLKQDWVALFFIVAGKAVFIVAEDWHQYDLFPRADILRKLSWKDFDNCPRLSK